VLWVICKGLFWVKGRIPSLARRTRGRGKGWSVSITLKNSWEKAHEGKQAEFRSYLKGEKKETGTNRGNTVPRGF